ncbi:MAG: hypothetical protein PHW02_05095 [bacterium]|nr:hypothetical protein [bacterium]
MKGTLSVKEYSLGEIANNSLNAELKLILYDALSKQIPQYGNIQLKESEEAKDTLSVEIKDYHRKEDAYDAAGNILSYRYSLSIDYIASNKRFPVNAVKSFNSSLGEAECKDSISNESVKQFIDKLRGDF